MLITNEKTELALRSISMAWLVEGLFKKYAPEFADGVDWKAYRKLKGDDRKNASSNQKNKLKDTFPHFHNDLCGALNVIMIAANSRTIKRSMHGLLRNEQIKKRFYSDHYKGRWTDDGESENPINLATWFCVRETELPAEWDKIKQFALSEGQRYYNWTWYNTTPATLPSNEEQALANFETTLRDIFQKEKQDKDFPVKARRISETKTFLRYCVSTAKDPIETFLAQNGGITPGNDPTANSFLIDHYFKADVIRIAYPDVIDPDRVANLFCEKVLGCKTTPDEPKVFLRSMRRYCERKESERVFSEIVQTLREVKKIDLKAIRFTVAENETKAEIRRKAQDNKNRESKGLPPLPRLRCEIYEDDNLFDQMERSFTQDARRKELVDVYELIYRVELFDDQNQPRLSKEYDCLTTPSRSYTLHVTPKKLSWSPRLCDIADDRHRTTLKEIQKLLKFENDLQPVRQLIAQGDA